MSTPLPAACEGPTLEPSAQLDAPYREASAALGRALAGRADIDHCATVHLVPEEGGAVLVVVELADGRSAVRHAHSPASAVASIEALLTVLPLPELPAPAPEPAPVAAQAPFAPLTPPRVDRPRSPTSRGRRSLELDVGAGAALRSSPLHGFYGYGVTAHVDVAINGWFLGSWLRWDFAERPLHGSTPRGFSASSFLLGAYTGRRFALRSWALDVLAGPGIVADSEEASGPTVDEVGGVLGSFTVGGSLRLMFPHRGAPSGYALLGGEVYPRRLHHHESADPSLPTLPSWSSTLALGASWSTL